MGRRTLGVYVLHPLPLMPLWWAVQCHPSWFVGVASSPVGCALRILLATSGVVAVAIAIEAVLRR